MGSNPVGDTKYKSWDTALHEFTQHYLACPSCGEVAFEIMQGQMRLAGLTRIAKHRAKALRTCCEVGAELLEIIILESEKLS